MTLIKPGSPEYEKLLGQSVQKTTDEQRGVLYPYWRQAKVVSVSESDPTCTIELGGDGTVDIGGVKFIRHLYRPQVGDWVWVMQNGSSNIVVGMIGDLQAPRPSGWTDQVNTSENTTSTSYTDLATYGPEIANILLYKDELVWIEVSAIMSNTGGPGHAAAITPVVSGADSLTAFDTNSAQAQDLGAYMVSRRTLWTVTTTGLHTFTAKYKVINPSTGTFANRRINVEVAGG